MKDTTTTDSQTPRKKTRIHRSPEMILELVLEAERTGNAAAICRRENISPTLFYRWRQKVKESAIQGIKTLRKGRAKADPEAMLLKAETERLKTALCEASIELQLLKKSVSSGYMDR